MKRTIPLALGIVVLFVGLAKLGPDGGLSSMLPNAVSGRSANARCEFCYSYHHVDDSLYLKKIRCGGCDAVMTGRDARRYFDPSRPSPLPGPIPRIRNPPAEGWGHHPDAITLIPVPAPEAPWRAPEPAERMDRKPDRRPQRHQADDILPFLNGGFR